MVASDAYLRTACLTLPDGEITSYGYDDLNRLTSMSQTLYRHHAVHAELYAQR